MDCRKGIGANLVEFCRYTVGQRQTADETMRGYDQGYSAKAIRIRLLAVRCFARAGRRSRDGTLVVFSVRPVQGHTLTALPPGQYGIEVNDDDIISGDLGRKLRTLGLILDSPDAESGMLLVSPFLSRPRGTGK